MTDAHSLERSGPAPATLLSTRRVVHTWWPLATSWLLMSLELPVVSAVMARLPDPRIHLAAYGGVVFPISLLIEAPIIMLLAASTALSRDWPAFLLVRRFMTRACVTLTAIHVLVAFTPLYDLVVGHVIDAPDAIVGPARIGLMIMTPWTWAIGYRRFMHGVLIRDGRSRVVGVGTLIRLGSNAAVLALGYAFFDLPGIVVGATAVAVGVVSEAIFVGLAVQPSLRRLEQAPIQSEALTWRAFFHFYTPLALTSMLTLIVLPIGAAGISRMPRPLESLAVWPVLSGLAFIFRGIGMAYNEVVVSLLDEPAAAHRLRRLAWTFGAASSTALLLMLSTPASTFWFATFSSLPPELVELGRSAAWMILILPLFAFLQSWFTGVLVHSRRTRGVSESVALSLTVNGSVIVTGVALGSIPGIYVGLCGIVAGALGQIGWLAYRSRAPLTRLLRHEEAMGV